MADPTLQTLYPAPDGVTATVPLKGTYLNQGLVSDAGRPYIYANLLASLDGRIALASTHSVSGMQTPDSIRSTLDWTLFCELQAHADVLVTHTGYLRSLASNDLGNILTLPTTEEANYLRTFRESIGLPAAPHVLVLSNSLDFDANVLPASNVTVLTTPNANVLPLQAHNIDVVISTGSRVSPHDVYKQLERMHARSVYLQTGPTLIHELIGKELLDRLYLTTDLSFVGGEQFKTVCEGPVLSAEARLTLRSMYLGSSYMENKKTAQQLFSSYDLK